MDSLSWRSLNVVRSGRPEQCFVERFADVWLRLSQCSPVWKTGTIRRANRGQGRQHRLNVVRSGRPEQSPPSPSTSTDAASLNVVRSGRPEQSVGRPYMSANEARLNVVRSGRPEQSEMHRS